MWHHAITSATWLFELFIDFECCFCNVPSKPVNNSNLYKYHWTVQYFQHMILNFPPVCKSCLDFSQKKLPETMKINPLSIWRQRGTSCCLLGVFWPPAIILRADSLRHIKISSPCTSQVTVFELGLSESKKPQIPRREFLEH